MTTVFQQTLSELDEYYEAWRSLSEAEGLAIAVAEWPRVLATQGAKEVLMTRVVEAENRLRAAIQGNPELGATAQSRFRPMTEQLSELERANLRQVEAARASIQVEQDQLKGTASRLRRVKGAYSGATANASWHSYS